MKLPPDSNSKRKLFLKKISSYLYIFISLSGFCFSCNMADRHIYAKDEQTINALGDTVLTAANRKFGIRFNSYRRQAGVPVLPDSFVLTNVGGDFVTWNSLSTQYPSLTEKTICFKGDEPSLIWENNVFRGPDNDAFRLRYFRINSDSFIVHYSDFPLSEKIEAEQNYKFGYVYYDKKGRMRPVNKDFYDSLMLNWGLNE